MAYRPFAFSRLSRVPRFRSRDWALIVTVVVVVGCRELETPDPCAIDSGVDLPVALADQLREAETASSLAKTITIKLPTSVFATGARGPARLRFDDAESPSEGVHVGARGVTGHVYLVTSTSPRRCAHQALTSRHEVVIERAYQPVSVDVAGAFFVDGQRSGRVRHGTATLPALADSE